MDIFVVVNLKFVIDYKRKIICMCIECICILVLNGISILF